ncbi:class F sortase [Streptomyces sp. NPDC020875]|uniref:class F sortase n=1 Tax=Streptomyces sp. NPDC020875 TaxID=3154898 RepID=UPI0033FF49F1
MPAVPPPAPPPAHRPSRYGAWYVLLCVLLLGVFLVRTGTEAADPGARAADGGPPRPAPSAAPPATGAADPPQSLAEPLPYAPPLRVVVPARRIDAPLRRVGLDSDGSIEAPPPDDAELAGWYTGSVSPGERGTSVVVGHVDTERGPAAFYSLGALGPGDRVEVVRADGRTAVFTVYGTESLPRAGFPAERVYADAPGPELRLITCGGRWSEKSGYEENVVVFARLAEPAAGPTGPA